MTSIVSILRNCIDINSEKEFKNDYPLLTGKTGYLTSAIPTLAILFQFYHMDICQLLVELCKIFQIL